MLDINNQKKVPVTLEWGWAIYSYGNGIGVVQEPILMGLYKSFHTATEAIKIKQQYTNSHGGSCELRKIPIMVDKIGNPYLLLKNGYTRTDFTKIVINN